MSRLHITPYIQFGCLQPKPCSLTESYLHPVHLLTHNFPPHYASFTTPIPTAAACLPLLTSAPITKPSHSYTTTHQAPPLATVIRGLGPRYYSKCHPQRQSRIPSPVHWESVLLSTATTEVEGPVSSFAVNSPWLAANFLLPPQPTLLRFLIAQAFSCTSRTATEFLLLYSTPCLTPPKMRLPAEFLHSPTKSLPLPDYPTSSLITPWCS